MQQANYRVYVEDFSTYESGERVIIAYEEYFSTREEAEEDYQRLVEMCQEPVIERLRG